MSLLAHRLGLVAETEAGRCLHCAELHLYTVQAAEGRAEAMTAAPVCDVNQTHGQMHAEHIYNLDHTIDTRFGLYWFCKVKGCIGYGGPVKKYKPQTVAQKQATERGQMEMEL